MFTIPQERARRGRVGVFQQPHRLSGISNHKRDRDDRTALTVRRHSFALSTRYSLDVKGTQLTTRLTCVAVGARLIDGRSGRDLALQKH
jgi:Fe-S cluster assembly ATPase SufC